MDEKFITRITGNAGKTILALERNGKSVDEIAHAVRKSTQELLGHYLVVGVPIRESDPPITPIRTMIRQGYHMSVIAAVMHMSIEELQEVLVTTKEEVLVATKSSAPLNNESLTNLKDEVASSSLSSDIEAKVIEMKKAGMGVRQIMDSLTIDSTTYAEAVRNEKARKLSQGVQEEPLPSPTDNLAISNNFFGSESSVTDGESRLEKLRTLASQGLTAYEISKMMLLDLTEVTTLADKNHIFVPTGAKMKMQVDCYAEIAYGGGSIADICKKYGVGKGNVRTLIKKVVDCKGDHHEIFEKLLAGVNKADTIFSHASSVVLSEGHLGPALTSMKDWSGTPDDCAVDPDGTVILGPKEMVRDAISEYAGEIATVISVLDRTALVLPVSTGEPLLVRFSEVMRFKRVEEWLIGDEVTYLANGEILKGIIKTPPFTASGEVSYAVRLTETQDDVVAASRFTYF